MPITATPSFTIGTTTDLVADYIVQVDWEDNNNFTDPIDDITQDALRLVFDRGRDTELSDMPAGTLALVVKDDDGDYSPENTATRFGFGNVTMHRKIRVQAIFDGNTIPLWQGRITEITPHPRRDERTAFITAADDFESMARDEIETPIEDEPFENVFIGDFLGPLFSILGQAGIGIIPSLVDDGQTLLNIHWVHKQTAFDAVLDLMRIEVGLAYFDEQGRFTFEDRSHRLAGIVNPHRVSQFNFNSEMVEFDYAFSGRTTRTIAKITGRDRRILDPTPTPTIVFETPVFHPVPANGTLRFRADYQEPARNVTGPFADDDFKAFANVAGTGTDFTSDISLAITRHGQSSDLLFSNSAASPRFLLPGTGAGTPVGTPGKACQIRGNSYSNDSVTIEDEADAPTLDQFGRRSLEIDSEFVSDSEFLQQLAIAKRTRFQIPQPDFITMKVIGSTPALLQAILTLRIHDRITITEPQIATNQDYFINRLQHETDVATGKITQVIYSLSRAGNETFWVLEDPVLGLLGLTTILGF